MKEAMAPHPEKQAGPVIQRKRRKGAMAESINLTSLPTGSYGRGRLHEVETDVVESDGGSRWTKSDHIMFGRTIPFIVFLSHGACTGGGFIYGIATWRVPRHSR